MSRDHHFWRWSRTVLDFRMQGARAPSAPQPPGPVARQRHLERALAALSRPGRHTVALLGLGAGALAADLAAALPRGARLAVCEPEPEAARVLLQRDGLPWWTAQGPTQLLTDASPWALALLLAREGLLDGSAALLLNPELPPGPGRDACRELQRVLAACAPARITLSPANRPPAPDLCLAAILHPDEPGLDRFLDQVPGWVRECVLVWDAERPPDAVPPCAAPLRHLARPLDGDFAAQRNAALDACHAPWVLFLDGDEQLPAPVWEALPALCGREEQGWWLPRLTLEGPAAPGGERVLIGHGLWPDLQLRLFRNRPGPRFQRPVHERLVGLEGPVGLLQNAQILHLSRVRKDPQALAEKLALFDRAAQGRVRHRLNSEYPALPLDAFEAEPGDALRALVLARNPA